MHSQLGFSVTMLGVSDISGTFKITEAKMTTTRDDFSDASVVITVDIKSIDTDVDDRDKHLRTADFFDAEKFPTAEFKSTSFKKSGTNMYQVSGNLTMHGVTKAVTWEAVGKTATHPMTNKTVGGFRVTGKINRRDFGISPATPAEMLADEVNLVANVQFVKN
jgi:polyisoprenoid-binding protein YceI